MATAKPDAFPPIEAGALLIAVTVLGLVAGTLAGWLCGAPSIGLVAGAVVGLPAGVFAVYSRYHGYFS
jgi:F0F1-type ATP synthase assembly protein I